MRFLANKFILSSVVVVALAVGGWVVFRGGEQSLYDTIVVERQDLAQEISTTGRVEAVDNVELAFEQAGRVSNIYAKIGDKVNPGDPLVVLEGGEEAAQLAQAQARFLKDKIKLDELKRGAGPEEIKVQEVKVANAKSAQSDAKRALVDTLNDSYTRADDAIRSKTDHFFTTNSNTGGPQLDRAFFDDSPVEVEKGKIAVDRTLKVWIASLATLTPEFDLGPYALEADQNLLLVKDLLNGIGLQVNELTPVINLTQAMIDSWKADVSLARSNINTAIANLSSTRGKLENANSSLALAEQELALAKSGATTEEIIAQEAQIKEAEANVKFFQAQLAKKTLHSPISGVVTEQNAKVGALASPSTMVVSIISEGKYQIEAFVVEADIANLSLGNTATLSLDAYGEDIIFKATVVKINPGADLQEGVANYKTTLEFAEANDKIKDGMTADIDIVTAKRPGVLAIPERALVFKDGKKLVRILNPDESVREVEVETGITGGKGLVEITNGLSEGDVVITATKK